MYFKTPLLVVGLAMAGTTIKGQSDYDVRIKELADEMAQQIKASGLKNIGVLGFFTDAGEEGRLGQLLAEDFSVHLTKPDYGYSLYNRDYIEALIEENKLGTVQGLVERETITELGKLKGLEGFVVGTYSHIGDVVRVRIKLLDAKTALQIGATMQNLEFDDNLKQYLGLNYGKSENNSNRGFNGPLSSNEQYNNPEKVADGCKEYKFGDICFYNSTGEALELRFIENFNPYGRGRPRQATDKDGKNISIYYEIYTLTLQPGETQCIYAVGVGPGEYQINRKDQLRIVGQSALRTGQILIEQCKSKTFTIK